MVPAASLQRSVGLFALGNPDQAVTGDDRPFDRLGDIAKGDQLCQMRRRYDGGGRGDRDFNQGSELFGRQKLRRMHGHRRTRDQAWPLSDWQGHREIYEPIPDRKRGLSVGLRIMAVLCFKPKRSGCRIWGSRHDFASPPDQGGHAVAENLTSYPTKLRRGAHPPALRRHRPRSNAIQRGGVVWRWNRRRPGAFWNRVSPL
jgi:hypothetical protein